MASFVRLKDVIEIMQEWHVLLSSNETVANQRTTYLPD